MIEETEIISIGEGFLACTFPGANFHHREHLVTTVYLLWTFPQRDWRGLLPDLIRRYNESQGGVNSDTMGYHETITMFYLDLVGKALALKPNLDLVQSCSHVLNGPASDKDFMLRYYSRELLFSSEARKRWVEPDVAPFQTAGLATSEPSCLPRSRRRRSGSVTTRGSEDHSSRASSA
jgi:hypothetical protein